ncbi:hypothetical protein CF074_10690 [Clostridium botulinum]|nr:hypothetical protein [Clostridium botulinum]
MEFNWSEFKYRCIAVHCNNENELNDFLKHCKENNINISSERKFNIKLCYEIIEGDILTAGDIKYFKNQDYDIIEWEIENKIDYDREYNILEIKEFPEETEFVNEDIYVTKFKDGILQVKNKTKNSLDSWSKCLITREWLRAKFKLIKKDKKVSFEEAIQAYLKGKDIKCIYNDETTIYNNGFIDSDDDKLTMGQILNGEWHIRED